MLHKILACVFVEPVVWLLSQGFLFPIVFQQESWFLNTHTRDENLGEHPGPLLGPPSVQVCYNIIVHSAKQYKKVHHSKSAYKNSTKIVKQEGITVQHSAKQYKITVTANQFANRSASSSIHSPRNGVFSPLLPRTVFLPLPLRGVVSPPHCTILCYFGLFRTISHYLQDFMSKVTSLDFLYEAVDLIPF